MLEQKALGRIVSITVTCQHTGGLAFNHDNWRFQKETNPGGPLFQCGIHKIDILLYLFGKGHWKSGYVQRQITETQTEDSYVLLGDFDNIQTTFHSSYVSCYRQAMEIYGTEGNLVIEEHPDRLIHKETNLNARREPTINLTGCIPKSDAEKNSLIDFSRAVREQRQPLVNGRNGLEALEIVFEAVKICL